MAGTYGIDINECTGVQKTSPLHVAAAHGEVGVVRLLCERVLVMRAGRIVDEGAPQALFERPRHAYTAELAAAVPRFPAA